MDALSPVAENRLLQIWGALRRHPRQLNALHEADAELVPLGATRVLAATVDTVDEEIACGLYPDPELVGWVAATAALSDLAAVAGTPLGLLVAATLPTEDAEAYAARLGRGLDAAAHAADTFVLGGDTGHAPSPSVTVTALGTVPRAALLTRCGLRPGDHLYVTGPLGSGAAWAAHVLLGGPAPDPPHLPRARLREARALCRHARCAMDTSDGLIATLDQLARLNGVRLVLGRDLASLLAPCASAAAAWFGVGPLTLLAAHHGEHELIIGVAPEAQDAFLAAAHAVGCTPLLVGHALPGAGLQHGGPAARLLDGAAIRNLAARASRDPRGYLAALAALTE